jgi:RNA polymerase sigma factor (sigma-70 family)
MEELTYYNRIIAENPLLSYEEEQYWATCIVKGRRNKQKAREKLFNSSLRLVISLASKKNKRYPQVPLLDMISNGHIGLMTAVDRFDPEKEARFSTYAYRWIELYVNKAIVDCNSHIKIPSNVLAQKRKFNEKSLKEGAKQEEIMKELDISEKEMRQIEAANASVISLNSEISSDRPNSKIEDIIEDQDAKGVVKEVCESEEIKLVKLYLDGMDDLRKDIIISRHLNIEKETLDSVGDRYNLSKERIRQLEKSALDELKSFIKKATKLSG